MGVTFFKKKGGAKTFFEKNRGSSFFYYKSLKSKFHEYFKKIHSEHKNCFGAYGKLTNI